MNKYFEYIGLIILTLFSFYYTDAVTKLLNNKDEVMIEIKEYASLVNTPCIEGYVTTEGAYLGKDGKEVNIDESYSNMQGASFDKEKIVYNEITCKVNSSISSPIINSGSKNIGIFIDIDNMNYIDDIIKSTNYKLNILLDGKMLNREYEYFSSLYSKGYPLVYKGNNNEDFKLFNKLMTTIDKKYILYVMNSSIDKGIRLKTNYIYSDRIYSKTINNLYEGSFYIYEENKSTLSELNTLLAFIKAKNIEILPITKALKS